MHVGTYFPLDGSSVGTPCAAYVNIHASHTWRNRTLDPASVVGEIVDRHRGDIAQMIQAGRQRCAGGLAVTGDRVEFPQLTARYIRQFGMEMVVVDVYPENTVSAPSAAKVAFGSQAKIKWPYNGFPFEDMANGASYTDVDGKSVEYTYDPGFTPNLPGEKVRPGGGLNDFLGAADPHTKPLNWVGEDTAPNKVAGSAILTTPVSGKQYWEVEIVELPRGQVPEDFSQPLPETSFVDVEGNTIKGKRWDGNKSKTMLCTSDQDGNAWTWDVKVDSFLTPCVGVCPGYFLPDDLLPGDPTAAPQTYQDYGMVLGLDAPWGVTWDKENDYDLARTVYVVATTVDQGVNTYDSWIQGHWVFVDPDTHEETFYIADSFITDPPPGGEPWPDYKVNYEWGYTVANSQGVYTISQHIDASFARDDGSSLNAIVERTETCIYWHGSYLGAAYVLSQYPKPGMPDREGAGCHAWYPGFNFKWEYKTGVGLGPITQPTPYHCNASGPPKGKHGNHMTGMPVYTELYENFVEAWPTADDQGIYSTYTDHFTWSGPEGLFEYDHQQWNCAAVDGTIDPMGATVKHIAGKYDDTVSSDGLVSDLFDIRSKDDVPTGAEWSKLYTAGGHMPAFVGRWDTLYQRDDYIGDGSETDTFIKTAPGNDIRYFGDFGCYTGVDLGELKEGDIIMIAVDAEEGYIWFGKNGKWFGKSGELDDQVDGPAHGTKWTAVLDGAKKSAYPITPPEGDWSRKTAKPQYFPCVSWRLGPGAVNIVYDPGSLTYAPPGGFDVYGQTTVAL